MVAAAIGLTATTGLVGSALQSNAASKAANLQSQEFDTSDQFAQSVYGAAGQNLAPNITAGQEATTMLQGFLGLNGTPGGGQGIQPFSMTQDQLEQTPGYEFDLSQGEKAVTNSNAAMGLGSSGAALKAAASYATGLAQNTYGQQYAMYQDNLNQIYNRLMGVSTQGAQSAQGLANAGTQTSGNIMSGAVQTGSNIGNEITGAANTQAAALNAPAQTAANYAISNSLIQGMYGNNNSTGFPIGGSNNA